MAAIEWIRFLIGGVLLLGGLVIFAVELLGVFRFRYVLNRMHAAAMGDTLGIGLSMAGLIVMSGFTFTSLKLFLVVAFLWFSSPASSHLISRLEVTTDEEPEKHYRRMKLSDLEAELSAAEAAAKSEAQEDPPVILESGAEESSENITTSAAENPESAGQSSGSGKDAAADDAAAMPDPEAGSDAEGRA